MNKSVSKIIAIWVLVALALLMFTGCDGSNNGVAPVSIGDPGASASSASDPVTSGSDEADPDSSATADDTPDDLATANAALIDEIWPQLVGFWSWDDVDPQFFIYFGYDYEDVPMSFYGVYYSEGTEWATLIDMEEIAEDTYKMTFWVPENANPEGLYDVHDEYFFDDVVNIKDIADGMIHYANQYESETMTIQFSGFTLDDALEKYDEYREW